MNTINIITDLHNIKTIQPNTIINADCLNAMQYIEDKSIDLILCDLPYGTTSCKWDITIPFEDLWNQYNRIIKNDGAIVLFGSEPFTSKLICSNIDAFKHDWIWKKNAGSNFGCVKFQPMKEHENICVFCNGKLNYNPIMQERTESGKSRVQTTIKYNTKTEVYKGGLYNELEVMRPELRYPSSVQLFNRERGLHPTQKPVDLLAYLIKTYSNEQDLILDNCAGSMSTAIACIDTNRKYIMIEKEEKYFNIGKERIEQHYQELSKISKSKELF